jgi:hypothetical protein
LIEGINHDGQMTDEEVDKLLTLLNNLMMTSQENALEYAFLAATTSSKYDHIIQLLNFCNKCSTSDENLVDSIEKFKHALKSYSSLFGIEASYARDSYWPDFWMGGNHWDLFDKMLSESNIDKCVELWNRYRDSLSNSLIESADLFFPEILRHLERTIARSSGEMCDKISAFLENDILPPFFSEKNVHYLIPHQNDLIDFFKRVSLSLWQLDQKAFPNNAYHFSSTIERIVNKLTYSIDTRQKKLVVLCFDQLGIGSIDSSSPYFELDRIVVKLKRLLHLKEAYNFVSSYEAYEKLTDEEIGNLLLDKIYTIANNIAYVKDVVFKFCDEVKLDRDTLLLNYIKKSDLSTKIANMCIGMCKLFKNDDFRAEAVMLIAPSFALPWSKELEEMFDILQSIDSLPEMTLQQLKEMKVRARISVIMSTYGGGFMLNAENSNDIIDYCTTLFSYTEVPIVKRVEDAQNICKLTLNNSKISTTEVECFVAVIKRTYGMSNSMQDLEDILNMFSCIKDLDVLENVAHQCANHAYRLLSSNNVLTASIPLSANFLIRVSQYLPIELKSVYIKQASSICQLYQLYRVVVFAHKLGNVEQTSAILRSIIDADGEKSIFELIEMGTLLMLSKEEIFILLIIYFVEKQRVERVEQVVKLIPSIFNGIKSDEFVEAIYYGLSYLFRFFGASNWSVLDIEQLTEFVCSMKAVVVFVFKHILNEFYLTKLSTVSILTRLD